MTMTENGLIVEHGYVLEDGGVCLTAMSEVALNIVDYAQMRDAMKHAVELYYGVTDGPVGNVWHDQQYDVVKDTVARLEAENPTWKEQYESGKIEYHLGPLSNG